jgi:hypothetical protein
MTAMPMIMLLQTDTHGRLLLLRVYGFSFLLSLVFCSTGFYISRCMLSPCFDTFVEDSACQWVVLLFD